MSDTVFVNDKKYTILKLLGKGKADILTLRK